MVQAFMSQQQTREKLPLSNAFGNLLGIEAALIDRLKAAAFSTVLEVCCPPYRGKEALLSYGLGRSTLHPFQLSPILNE